MSTATAPRAHPRQAQDESAEQVAAGTTAAATFRMPHGLTSIRFGLLIGAILVGGLVALLAVNTSLAAGAIKLGGLEATLARETEKQQALALAVEGLSSPESLQARAIALGMVPAPAPVFLDAATGKVSGQLLQAQPGTAPKTGAPMVTLPEPTPATTTAPPGTPTSRGNEPNARLVMPPDPGSDGASVTRSPARPSPSPENLPDASARADDGEPVLQDQPQGDSAAIVGGAR